MSKLGYAAGWIIVASLLIGCIAFLFHDRARGATTQLPPGEVCFQTSAGPVSSGSVNMYFPNTTTPKATWRDSGQVSQNNQPISLDQNGCAIIYGVGTYRQQLFDGPVVNGLTTGNLIFDLLTTDTSAFNQTFWAGFAAGTPNGIQLTDAGWNSTPGVILNFKAIANNTGPVTITILPSNFTAPLVVDTSVGPVPLSGGEIVQSNTPRLLFDNVANVFHLTNPATTSGSATGIPIGSEISCPGFNPPANFVFENGQLVLRSLSALFAALTLTQAGVATSGSPIISGLTDTSQLAVGMAVEEAGVIPPATTISSVDSTTQIHISNNPTATVTGNIIFFAYSNGDGSTTFGVPDRRGQLLYGRDNMGGTAKNVLTSTYTTNTPDALGQNMLSPARVAGGGLSIAQGYLPAVGLSVNIPGGQGSHTHALVNGGGVYSFIGGGPDTINAGGNNNANTTTIANQTLPAMTGSTSVMGSSVPISPISPGQTTNWCIRTQ